MILAIHQPIFLPWPGFFHKAMHVDRMVLLDGVQFPRGRTWLNRNRLKNEDGELWLTVPVHKKGRGLQTIRQVEIYDERDWRKKHLQSIRQNYANAPYFDDVFAAVEPVYEEDHRLLAAFNVDLIRVMWDALSIDTELVLQSDLGIYSNGTKLLTDICRHVGADRLAVFPHVEKHLDAHELTAHGIDTVHLRFRPLVYPQLWGDFIYNLSALDMLFNLGARSREIIHRA
jgi:hypothetical protein